MRNLKVFPARLRDLACDSIGFCVDADNDTLFIISRQLKLTKISLSEKKKGTNDKATIKHDFDTKENLLDTKNHLLCFEYLVEFNSVLVALRNGSIFRIGVAGNDSTNYHHQHPKELDSVQISPSQDLIALSDSQHVIRLLSTDFQLVAESNASTNEDSKHRAVGVGWGSKETQFFGLDGRPSKEGQSKKNIDLTDEEVKLYDKIETSQDFRNYLKNKERNTIIDWRGDGQYLASLTYHSNIDKHQLKVWNKSLVLQFISDKLIDIERGLLHWVPSGNFVCCAQRRERKINEILSLEKNGMIHMRLELPTILNNLYIDDFSWSPDSTVLAVIARKYDLDGENTSATRQSMLMLFTVSNQKYYLKHTRYLTETNQDYTFKWNPNDSNCLFILSEKGHYQEYHITFDVNFSNDKGNVIVVDGNKLHVTPLKICSKPPPMSALVVELPELVKGIGLDANKADTVIVLTANNNLIVIDRGMPKETNTFSTIVSSHVRIDQSLPAISESQFHHMIPISDNKQYDFIVPLSNSPGQLKYLAIEHQYTRENEPKTHMDLITISNSSKQKLSIDMIENCSSESIVSAIVDYSEHGVRIIHSDGTTARLACHPRPHFVKDNAIRQTAPIYNLIQSQLDVNGRFITLSIDQTLFCDSKVISKDCSSFRLTSQFLLYTTTSNALKILPLTEINKPGTIEPWSQKIEDGGTLILVDPEEARVILQMPRGNLEIIHPRLLVLCLVQKLMIEEKFLASTRMVKRHRLNTNFLADCLIHRDALGGDIYESIQKFAKDLVADKKDGESLLILFLNELVDDQDDFFGRYSKLVTFIPDFGREFRAKSPVRVPQLHYADDPEETRHKLVLRPLIDMEDELPLKVHLMIAIKLGPDNFEQPLMKLVQNAKNDANYDEGIKFLLYHGLVDDLYNDALRIHDTKLALMIAKKSNKDPKEYLPLLSKFNSIESKLLRYYEISSYVGDNERALRYLVKYHLDDDFENTEAFDSIIELIERKKLYKSGIEEFLWCAVRAPAKCKSTIDRFIEIMASKYANYMLAKRYYVQAGLLYSMALRYNPQSIEYYNGGIKCFELCDRLDLSLPLHGKFKFEDAGNTISLDSLTKLATSFAGKGKPLEAYLIRKSIADKQRSSQKASPPQIDEVAFDDFLSTIGPAGYYFADFIAQTELEHRFLIYTDLTRTCIRKFKSDWEQEIEQALENFSRLKDLITGYFSKRSDLGAGGSTYTYVDDTLSTTDGSEVSSIGTGTSSRNHKKSSASSLKTRDTSKTTKSQAARKKRLNFKRGSRYEDIAVIIKLREFVETNRKNQEIATDILVTLYEIGSDFAKNWFQCHLQANWLRGLMKRSYDLATIIVDTFWPSTVETHTDFSLFERFHDALSKPAEEIETIDIEILVRPTKPKEPNYLELFTFPEQAC